METIFLNSYIDNVCVVSKNNNLNSLTRGYFKKVITGQHSF